MGSGDGTVHQSSSPNQEARSPGVGISPWACYQCKRSVGVRRRMEKGKMICVVNKGMRYDIPNSDKSTPSCGPCLRNMQGCCYPSTALKPGPKLGSYRKHRFGHTRHRSQGKTHLTQQPHNAVLAREQSRSANAASRPQRHVSGPEIKSNDISNWILHHFHEAQAYQDENEGSHRASPLLELRRLPTPPKVLQDNNIAYISHFLGVTKDELFRLTDIFFSHISSVSLFHRPTFEQRVFAEIAPDQAVGLLASMFSFSTRHISVDEDARWNPERFYGIASDTAHRQLRNFGDDPPPLSILQTLILTTHYELIRGVRGVAWRSLGAIIRIALELRLHFVDLPLRSKSTGNTSDSVEVWVAKEERRRAWWTIWELETFATTIRRCPFGINPSEHATLLPVDDTFWFEGKETPSCFLEADPVLRWKELQKSGNESGRAWFIVINSLMRDAHTLSNPPVPHGPCTLNEGEVYWNQSIAGGQQKDSQSDVASQLAVLDNCVSCFTLALPQRLRYRSELLFTHSISSGYPTEQRTDSEKQAIHAMTQLAKLMIFHKDCFRNDRQTSDLRHPEKDDYPQASSVAEVPIVSDEAASDSSTVWSRYLDAADHVVSIVRNASPDHIRYGDPLLANTFWIVASIQIVQKTFAKTRPETMVAQSNFDLLRLTLIKHRDFWNSSAVLVQNLEKLENSLSTIQARLFSRTPIEDHSNTRLPLPEDETISYTGGAVDTNTRGLLDSTTFGEFRQMDNSNGGSEQVSMSLPEGLFSFNSGNETCNTSIDDPIINSTMDMPMDAIFSGLWEQSQQRNVIFNDDVLGNFMESDSL